MAIVNYGFIDHVILAYNNVIELNCIIALLLSLNLPDKKLLADFVSLNILFFSSSEDIVPLPMHETALRLSIPIHIKNNSLHILQVLERKIILLGRCRLSKMALLIFLLPLILLPFLCSRLIFQYASCCFTSSSSRSYHFNLNSIYTNSITLIAML
jgi:hypothetical protein